MKPPRVTGEVIITDPVRCRIFLERLMRRYREMQEASPRLEGTKEARQTNNESHRG